MLPDTYKITRGDQRSKILAWMADAERTALNDIWKRRSADLPIHSAQELVVLASIVEKETSKADERPRVAGVLLNRLQKNIRLQSDPTIVYGLTGGKGPLGHGLTKDEIAKPTPYNTYTIDGLPPGPIANPGRAAMEAVANPSRTKEFYFVADGTGGHVFAETLDQHLHNVARWRQIEADRAAASAAARSAGNPPGTARKAALPLRSPCLVSPPRVTAGRRRPRVDGLPAGRSGQGTKARRQHAGIEWASRCRRRPVHSASPTSARRNARFIAPDRGHARQDGAGGRGRRRQASAELRPVDGRAHLDPNANRGRERGPRPTSSDQGSAACAPASGVRSPSTRLQAPRRIRSTTRPSI